MKNNEKIYFDYNIYDGIVKGFFNLPDSFREDMLFVSVAHAEEYYNAKCNDVNGKNHQRLKRIETMMKKSSEFNGVLNPSREGVFLRREYFKETLKRVDRYDTRGSIESTSYVKHGFRKNEFEHLLDDNQNLMFISNLDEKEIWEQTEVCDKLENIENRIDYYNRNIVNALLPDYGMQAFELEKKYRLPHFDVTPDMCKSAKISFTQLEFLMEVLGDILNEVGYCKDNKVENVKSGAYDTEHSIYATYCDWFVTNDKKLRKRLNAIYDYLGIKTRCISYKEFEEALS